MNILITSPRAPVVLDWMRVFADADKTVLCDSLRFPLAAFAARSNPRVRYCRIPPPRYDFAGYAAAMRGLVAEADFVVPTCEDIFYLAHVPLPESEREKLFMPPRTLLLGLHDKFLIICRATRRFGFRTRGGWLRRTILIGRRPVGRCSNRFTAASGGGCWCRPDLMPWKICTYPLPNRGCSSSALPANRCVATPSASTGGWRRRWCTTRCIW